MTDLFCARWLWAFLILYSVFIQKAQDRKKIYQKFYNEVLFPTITKRYRDKHGDSFPMSGMSSVDMFVFHIFRTIPAHKKKWLAVVFRMGGSVLAHVSETTWNIKWNNKKNKIHKRMLWWIAEMSCLYIKVLGYQVYEGFSCFCFLFFVYLFFRLESWSKRERKYFKAYSRSTQTEF